MNYKKNLENCFHLLQKVISNAYGTDTLLYTPPYENLSEIDLSIRDLILPGYTSLDPRLIPSPDSPDRRIFVVKSTLGFYNIIVFMSLRKKADFFSIGPFRSEEFTPDYLDTLTKDMLLPKDTYLVLQRYYNSLPYIPMSPLMTIIKEIIATYFPEYRDYDPIYIEYTNSRQIIQIDTQALNDITAEYAEDYRKSLFSFLESLVKGDYESASAALTEHLQSSRFFYLQNLDELRKEVFSLNGYCRTALLGGTVHPSYVLQLSSSLVSKIEETSNRISLQRLANDICHKYCLLVKNYAFHEYSKSIRAIINYIHLHLDEELSLSRIAEHFHKNASSLSAAFSSEVGMSITNYIHQARIKEAILYFNTTKMSISEVSLAVGIQDFAYFSRLFHKHIGCSPREYCKNIQQK